MEEIHKDTIVELNVGGVAYTTTENTLCRYPDSMLAKMFSGNMRPGMKDSHGRFVIDRDGDLFAVILQYLRTGGLYIPLQLRTAMDYDAMLFEANYYGLEGLAALLEPYASQPETPMETEQVYKFPFAIDIKGDGAYGPTNRFVLRLCKNCNQVYVENGNSFNSCLKPKKRDSKKQPAISSAPHSDDGYAVDSLISGIQWHQGQNLKS